MYIKNNPDFKTVWQLAHDWVNVDPHKTDTHAIEPDLRIAIHRLMLAMTGREISARWKGLKIFRDDSFLSMIFDSYHDIKFLNCLGKNKFDKNYLDNLYVKRNEVINWCSDSLLDPPPCWKTEADLQLKEKHHVTEETDDDNTGWYGKLTPLRRRKVICKGLAEQLWKKYPDFSYEEMHEYPIMKELGYSSKFTFQNFKKLVRPVASESAKMPGSRQKNKEIEKSL